jgi:hypothetical protein
MPKISINVIFKIISVIYSVFNAIVFVKNHTNTRAFIPVVNIEILLVLIIVLMKIIIVLMKIISFQPKIAKNNVLGKESITSI